jgi:Tfp pilus assembly protein PilF
MSEIAVTDLDPRWRKQVGKLQNAVVSGEADFAIALAERILGEFPGCLEVRQLLRTAQKRKHRKNTTGFARWLGGMGVQLRSGGLSRKDPAKALEEAEKSLTRDPSNISAHRLLGQAAMELDLPATAVFAFSAIQELDGKDKANQLALGAALIKADRADEAVRLAEKMQKTFPEDGEVEALLKDASVALSLRVGNWEEEGNYRQKLSDQSESEALEQQRRHISPEQTLRERTRILEAEIEKQPGELRRYRDLAGLWRELGEPLAALECIRKAQKLPDFAHDLSLAELADEIEGDVLRQRLSACQAQLLAAPVDVASGRAVEEAEKALQQHERRRLQALVNQYPHDSGHRLAYGEALLREGDADGAAAQFQRAVDSPKQRTGALMGLGRAFKLRDRHDLALKQFDKALSENVEMTEERKAAMYEKADTAFLLGRNDEAREAFASILEVDVAYRDVSARLDALN